MKKYKNYILLGVCTVLATSSIFMTIETATVGLTMSKIEEEGALLLDQRLNMEESLVRGVSLSELEEKSQKLGFSKATSLFYVSSVVSVAKLP